MIQQEKNIAQGLLEIQQFEVDLKGIIDYCEDEWSSIEDDTERTEVYDTTAKYTKEALETIAAHVDILGTNLTHYLIMQDNELNYKMDVTQKRKGKNGRCELRSGWKPNPPIPSQFARAHFASNATYNDG